MTDFDNFREIFSLSKLVTCGSKDCCRPACPRNGKKRGVLSWTRGSFFKGQKASGSSASFFAPQILFPPRSPRPACHWSLGITITLGLFGGWKRAPAARTARATRRPRPPRGRGRLGGASSRGSVLVSLKRNAVGFARTCVRALKGIPLCHCTTTGH